ncbi:calcium uniporter protein, mitochondrial-like [Chanos chanos]|uniref:Calcium uniporter protein n=1 Tax=Chanos chanos TaxID=29144 RepID=A0A6J2VFU9_CHACN|nr:calcium uniporter protein, mitochondrial-like [Chanos chanos]
MGAEGAQVNHKHPWAPIRAALCSTTAPPTVIAVQHRHGRPVLVFPLPSRNELCRFSVRPMLMTVGDLISDIQREDPGVTMVKILTADGGKFSSTTFMDTVLSSDFQLVINDVVYSVHSPTRDRESHEHVTELEDVKTLVHMLHVALNLPEHHMFKQKQLLERQDALRLQLQPLEKKRAQLARKADRKAMLWAYGGLAFLSVQGGVLGWLTWCLFSWDVMEPVTYFLTYATSMCFFSYYILTKQDCIYPDAKDRQFLQVFYRRAEIEKFDVGKYNQLKNELAMVENDLKRLRSPIQLQLPVEQLQQ